MVLGTLPHSILSETKAAATAESLNRKDQRKYDSIHPVTKKRN